MVSSTERSIKPITYICGSFHTWHYKTDYKAIKQYLKKKKHFKKNLDIRDYFLFPMSVVFKEILHPQYKPYTAYLENN